MIPNQLTMFTILAPSGEQGPAGPLVFLVQMALIIGIFYFLLIRPKVKQERQHRERLSHIRRGDRVITAGGVIGEVVHIKDNQLTVKSGESRLLIQRERVAEVVGEESEGGGK